MSRAINFSSKNVILIVLEHVFICYIIISFFQVFFSHLKYDLMVFGASVKHFQKCIVDSPGQK